MDGSLEAIRRSELEAVRAWFGPGQRVLEIGGANGFQASLLASWGCEVTSVDLPGAADDRERYHPVLAYDGRNLPVADGSVDTVFSSNVLEHVERLPEMLDEIRRALRPDGRAIHILPSSSWRLWSLLARYLHYVRRAIQMVFGRSGGGGHSSPSEGGPRGLGWYLVEQAHGAYPSAVSELWYFSKRRWLSVFREAGYEVIDVKRTGLFATGQFLLPMLSPEARARIGSFLGLACHAYLLSPRGGERR